MNLKRSLSVVETMMSEVASSSRASLLFPSERWIPATWTVPRSRVVIGSLPSEMVELAYRAGSPRREPYALSRFATWGLLAYCCRVAKPAVVGRVNVPKFAVPRNLSHWFETKKNARS